jgi:hypothetical protein
MRSPVEEIVAAIPAPGAKSPPKPGAEEDAADGGADDAEEADYSAAEDSAKAFASALGIPGANGRKVLDAFRDLLKNAEG